MNEESLPAAQLRGHRAGLASRAMAAGVDLATVVVIGSGVLLGAALLRYVVDGPPFRPPVLDAWLGSTAGALVVVGYLVLGWTTSGRTVGMQVLGVRVVDGSGRPLRVGRALVRAVLCVVLPIGLLWVLVSRRNASVQDLLVRTAVVYDWAYGVGSPDLDRSSARGDSPVRP